VFYSNYQVKNNFTQVLLALQNFESFPCSVLPLKTLFFSPFCLFSAFQSLSEGLKMLVRVIFILLIPLFPLHLFPCTAGCWTRGASFLSPFRKLLNVSGQLASFHAFFSLRCQKQLLRRPLRDFVFDSLFASGRSSLFSFFFYPGTALLPPVSSPYSRAHYCDARTICLILVLYESTPCSSMLEFLFFFRTVTQTAFPPHSPYALTPFSFRRTREASNHS